MAKKIYTLEIDEKNLGTSAKSKAAIEKKSAVQTEVESFGIVEINNASASKKMKNKQDKGFEKVIVGTSKKSVKAEVSKVEDYFDFSFRPIVQVQEKVDNDVDEEVYEFIKEILGYAGQDVGSIEEIAQSYAEAEDVVETKTVKATKKVTTKSKKKADSKTATILKVEAEHIEEIRNCQVQAEVSAYDDDARYNIDIARLGSLFDCEKTMLN